MDKVQKKEENNEELRSFRIAEKEDASLGPIFAIIIIVALLAMGALYSIRKVPIRNYLPKNPVSGDSVIKNYANQGTSDSATEIGRDLSATAIQALDQGLSPLK